MYTVTVDFTICEGFEEAFLVRVKQQASDSLKLEAGCQRFDVSTSVETPARVFLYELYDDSAAFDTHLNSDHFRSFDAEVGAMVASKTVGRWNLRQENQGV